MLLLHGYPQTHAMWHKVAPELARGYSVVCPDLRGYGDSSKPKGLPDHSNYSKRAMANDMVEVMRALGHERFHVVGHDRGGRVAHRMARDHASRVRTLTVLDISPTLKMYRSTNMQFAKAYFHWFFLIQEAPLPERMLEGQGPYYLLSGWGAARAGSSTSPRKRSPSTSAPFAIRAPSTRPARTIAPRRRSTSCTTSGTARSSACRCSRFGESRA